jgi:hypothetical protein
MIDAVGRSWTKLSAAGRRSAYWWYARDVTWRSSAVSMDESGRANRFERPSKPIRMSVPDWL